MQGKTNVREVPKTIYCATQNRRLQCPKTRATPGMKPKNITEPQLVVWMTREQIESVDDILRRLGSDDAEAIRRTLTRAAAEADKMHKPITGGTGTK